MQQTNLTNFINTAAYAPKTGNSPRTITVDKKELIHPADAKTRKEKKEVRQNKRKYAFQAAKEIGITAGMGITGGVLAGGVASLIPVKNVDGVSAVLCDVFIKKGLNDTEEKKNALPKVSFDNAEEQIQKAKEYIEISKISNNPELSKEEAKTVSQKFSDAVWALKKSSIEYVNKAAKEDGLLVFAKKEAKKIRTKEIMSKSLSIGIATAFTMLLLNTLGGMFNKKSDKE